MWWRGQRLCYCRWAFGYTRPATYALRTRGARVPSDLGVCMGAKEVAARSQCPAWPCHVTASIPLRRARNPAEGPAPRCNVLPTSACRVCLCGRIMSVCSHKVWGGWRTGPSCRRTWGSRSVTRSCKRWRTLGQAMAGCVCPYRGSASNGYRPCVFCGAVSTRRPGCSCTGRRRPPELAPPSGGMMRSDHPYE